MPVGSESLGVQACPARSSQGKVPLLMLGAQFPELDPCLEQRNTVARITAMDRGDIGCRKRIGQDRDRNPLCRNRGERRRAFLAGDC